MSRLYEKIEYYAQHAPDHKAFTYRVSEQYESIDYVTLRDYVDSLSAQLSDHASQTIAILGNNKLEYAVSLLAVLGRVGDALLIDKELGREDILRIFETCRPDLILLDDAINLSFEGFSVLRFSEICEMMRGGQKSKVDPDFAGSLILHTSGTTGEPKCVRLSEAQYYGVIPELNQKWGVLPQHSCLFIIPLYHVYALTSLFHGLYAGIENILEWDYKRIDRVLKETHPCLFMGVPLMYNRIKDAIFEKAGARIKVAVALSNLLLKLGIDLRKKLFGEIYSYFGGQYVFGVSAGSLLPYPTSKFFHDVGLPIYNVYGMTETSGPVAINYQGHDRYDSVGEILNLNEVVIRNADENGVGQVCVRGSNVFDGYLGEKESANFDGEYFYTGDLGYVKDGFLYVIGREKGILVGANGKNVSPEELNRKILECNRIHDCNVILEKDRLVAIVNTELSEDEVRNHLDKVNQSLPKYKRIADFRITQKNVK